jgi:hypothetical protein
MLNLIRKFLRPTLREQLEVGVREALRRYADRHTAPSLRVFVSTDLVPKGMDPALWARDEAEHLRRFALQWAEDNHIARAGLRVEVVLLDTKREFAFVKPMGLEESSAAGRRSAVEDSGAGGQRLTTDDRQPTTGAGGGTAVLEVIESPGAAGTIRVAGTTTLGRKGGEGVEGLGDRYMSARHARLHVERGRLWVTDLDSKNRTFVNDQPLTPHQPQPAAVGDTLRMGATTLRVARVEG